MTGAKQAILGRIRSAIGERPAGRAAGYAAIRREYSVKASLERDACLTLFTERLTDYGVTVYRCGRAGLAAAVAQAAQARGKRRLLAPAGIPSDWLPSGVEFIADKPFTHAELDAAEGTLTGCSGAIAVTGSIVLTHGPAEGRRALTLVPDYHLCIVFEEQVVETVPESIRRMSAEGASLITTISGPSATADIEMTRVKGVHGPRTLDVILAG